MLLTDLLDTEVAPNPLSNGLDVNVYSINYVVVHMQKCLFLETFTFCVHID
jgi:hypothetical protein